MFHKPKKFRALSRSVTFNLGQKIPTQTGKNIIIIQSFKTPYCTFYVLMSVIRQCIAAVWHLNAV